MTEKQERILEVALELFANEGFNGTSTKRIAEQAEVSEGLLFKHFGNKKGILEAVMRHADEKVLEIEQLIACIDDPKEIFKLSLTMPFELTDGEYDFWRLQFKLKWDAAYDNPEKMNGVLKRLAWAFEKSGYENPETEAIIFNNQIEMIMSEILRGNMKKVEAVRDLLLEKYVG